MSKPSDLRFKTQPVLDEAALPLKEQACHPVVLLQPGLVLEEQVATMARSVFYQLHLVSNL